MSFLAEGREMDSRRIIKNRQKTTPNRGIIKESRRESGTDGREQRVETVWRRRRKFNVSRRGLCLFGVDDRQGGSDAQKQKQQENTAKPAKPS